MGLFDAIQTAGWTVEILGICLVVAMLAVMIGAMIAFYVELRRCKRAYQDLVKVAVEKNICTH